MVEKPFYIGWAPAAPKPLAAFLKRILPFLLAVVLLGSVAFVLGQKKANNATFEFGKLTEVEGELALYPVPRLIVDNPNGELGPGKQKSLLLIGFGKFGAQKVIREIEKQVQSPIEGRKLTLEGTLIYYDGKALIELTNNEASIKEIGGLKVDGVVRDSKSEAISLGQATLVGEIIDPKCYFGVMKPGDGKIHRSCAVRCISGGIPPVLKVSNEAGESQYYLLLSESGHIINQDVLPYVARKVRIQGELEQSGDWLVLKSNPETYHQLD